MGACGCLPARIACIICRPLMLRADSMGMTPYSAMRVSPPSTAGEYSGALLLQDEAHRACRLSRKRDDSNGLGVLSNLEAAFRFETLSTACDRKFDLLFFRAREQGHLCRSARLEGLSMIAHVERDQVRLR